MKADPEQTGFVEDEAANPEESGGTGGVPQTRSEANVLGEAKRQSCQTPLKIINLYEIKLDYFQQLSLENRTREVQLKISQKNMTSSLQILVLASSPFLGIANCF